MISKYQINFNFVDRGRLLGGNLNECTIYVSYLLQSNIRVAVNISFCKSGHVDV